MTDGLSADRGKDAIDLNPIMTFAIKVGILTAAFCTVIFFALYVAQSQLAELQERYKGGGAFWRDAEIKLYKLADEPDLSPEKKARILAALKKISNKYKPYFDALKGD
jgi:hypothetical protein